MENEFEFENLYPPQNLEKKFTIFPPEYDFLSPPTPRLDNFHRVLNFEGFPKPSNTSISYIKAFIYSTFIVHHSSF